MTWMSIRPSRPPVASPLPRRPTAVMVCETGMMTAWYGTKIPKRISGKTTLENGKRNFDSTNPLAQPSSAEIRLAGMDSARELRKPEESLGSTALKLSKDRLVGSSQMRVTLTSAGFLNDVTMSTYTGMRKNAASAQRMRYRTV